MHRDARPRRRRPPEEYSLVREITKFELIHARASRYPSPRARHRPRLTSWTSFRTRTRSCVILASRVRARVFAVARPRQRARRVRVRVRPIARPSSRIARRARPRRVSFIDRSSSNELPEIVPGVPGVMLRVHHLFDVPGERRGGLAFALLSEPESRPEAVGVRHLRVCRHSCAWYRVVGCRRARARYVRVVE